MKTIVLSIIAMLLISSWAHGQNKILTDPELDYATTEEFQDYMVPTIDEVIRMDLDLNHDGKPVVFLAYRNFCDRSGQIWTAYLPTNGGYLRFDHTEGGHLIHFLTGKFCAIGDTSGDATGSGLNVLYPGKGGGRLVHYDIKNDTAKVKDVEDVDYFNTKKGLLLAEHILGGKIGEGNPRTIHPITNLSAAAIKSRTK